MVVGGEGATAREILRHKTIERVVMVDIDKVGRLSATPCICLDDVSVYNWESRKFIS